MSDQRVDLLLNLDLLARAQFVDVREECGLLLVDDLPQLIHPFRDRVPHPRDLTFNPSPRSANKRGRHSLDGQLFKPSMSQGNSGLLRCQIGRLLPHAVLHTRFHLLQRVTPAEVSWDGDEKKKLQNL